YRSAFTEVMVEKAGRGLIVSYHDLKGTPEDLDGFYAAMRERGADVVKIAVTPHSVRDVGRLLDFAARTAAAGPGQVPAAEMADLYRARDVNPLTKLYGVLGSDVVWSLSPVLHNRAFEARGLDAVYVPLQAESLEGFLAALPAFGLSGFSVTRPFKVDIVPQLQEVEEQAALSGSVNTVVVHDGGLSGSTTDGIGVLAPLKRRLDVKGRAVVIIGAGGAARAATVALQRKGARVTLAARRPEKAAAVATALGCAHAGIADLGR